MNLAEYLDGCTQEAVRSLCKRLKRHRFYLRRVASGLRKASHSTAIKIEELTEGQVARWELRPDIWTAPKKRTNGSKNK